MNWKGAVVSDFLPRAARQLGGGLHVWRESSDLPEAEVAAPLFRIDGGLVLLTRLVGIVTTEIEPLVNTVSLVYQPDAPEPPDEPVEGAEAPAEPVEPEGVSLGGSLDIGGMPPCTILTVPGHADKPIISGLMATDQEMDLLCGPGTIRLTCSAAATGQLRWVVTYVSLEPTATVEADDTVPEPAPAVEAEVAEPMLAAPEPYVGYTPPGPPEA